MPSWLWSNTLRLFASNVGGAACGLTAHSCRRAASKRPLSVHNPAGAIRLGLRVRKPSTQMNVELVVGQEVLGRHANGMASRPQSAGH